MFWGTFFKQWRNLNDKLKLLVSYFMPFGRNKTMPSLLVLLIDLLLLLLSLVAILMRKVKEFCFPEIIQIYKKAHTCFSKWNFLFLQISNEDIWVHHSTMIKKYDISPFERYSPEQRGKRIPTIWIFFFFFVIIHLWYVL